MRINIPLFTALLGLATATPASMTSLARREECPPYTSCHPDCEGQRSNLAECNCMYMTCGLGGADYVRFKTRYDDCCDQMQVLQKMRDGIPGTVAHARDVSVERGASVVSEKGVERREGQCDGQLGKPCRESCTEARAVSFGCLCSAAGCGVGHMLLRDYEDCCAGLEPAKRELTARTLEPTMVSEASATTVEPPVQRREKGKCPLKKLCHDDCDGWKQEFEDCLCLGGQCGKGVYLLDAYEACCAKNGKVSFGP